MRAWQNMVERAREMLGKETTSSAADAPATFPRGEGKGCESCVHYLWDNHCNINLERECRDGQYEAWEARRGYRVDLRVSTGRSIFAEVAPEPEGPDAGAVLAAEADVTGGPAGGGGEAAEPADPKDRVGQD